MGKGYGLDLAKPFRNLKDTLLTGATVGAGAAGGALAPKVQSGIANAVDATHDGMSTMEWLDRTAGGKDPMMPWYAGQGGGQSDMSSQIPNLSLLPQEVRQQAMGGAAAGGAAAGGAGPNWEIQQAGQRIAQIDTQLNQQQAILNDPNQSPMARAQANKAVQAMTLQRDRAIAEASRAQKTMQRDQASIESRIAEEQAQAASRQKSLTREQERLAKGPQRKDIDSKMWSWLPFQGNMPSQRAHAEEQRLLEDLMLRNQERQWQMENRDDKSLIDPNAQQILTQYGI